MNTDYFFLLFYLWNSVQFCGEEEEITL